MLINNTHYRSIGLIRAKRFKADQWELTIHPTQHGLIPLNDGAVVAQLAVECVTDAVFQHICKAAPHLIAKPRW